MKRFDGRVVLVTGGANGLGRAYCEALCRQGARVVVADLDADGATALAGSLTEEADGGEAVGVGVDVTSGPAVVAMVEAALSAFGRIDVLVNNAGSYPHVPFERIDPASWDKVLSINLESVFLCSRAVLPGMTEQGSGKIVNIATNLVWSGLANMAHYIAAKAGVVGLTKALAREFGDAGVTVNALAPGAVIPRRRLSASGENAVDEIVRYQCVKRPQTAQDLVGPLLFLVSSDSDFMSGQVITVDGGLTMH